MKQEELAKLEKGDLVVIAHPLLVGTHVVARVVAKPTRVFVMLEHFRPSRVEWGHSVRRNLVSIVSRVEGSDPVPTARALLAAAERLRHAQNSAAGQYEADVAAIARGDL